MWTPVPWAVGGGALISVDLGRLLAYAATAGAEGIVNPGDLRVAALATPGAGVRVAPGSAIIRNRYANARSQSYVADNPVQHTVPIRATGSGAARTDLIIARVYDPQFGGQSEPKPAPGEVQTFQYVRTEVIEGVPADADHTYVRTLGYPAIALARVSIPASTATITAGMIQDLRRVANPRSERTLHTVFPTGQKNTSGHLIPTSSYASWPIRANERPTVWVPEWATSLTIVAHYSGIYFHRGASTVDTVAGIRTGFGSSASENGIIIEDVTEEGGRKHYTVVGTHAVPESVRGTYQGINLQGLRTAGSGSWWADYQSLIAIDVEFVERPV